MTHKIKGIVFDMDGVLVDTEEFYYERRKNFLKEYGLSIDEIPIATFIGADMRSIWPLVLSINKDQQHSEAFLNEQYLEYKREHPLDFVSLLDADAKRTLQFLKRNNYKIGLASSSQMEAIEEMLESTQLKQYFDSIVSGEDFEKSKPEPEIYQYAVAELKLTPEECIAIEDSEKGIQSAHAAGLTVWAIKDTRFGINQNLANDTLEKLSEMCRKLSDCQSE
ncbi:HAD family hydrolase [Enterococcus rivorum]|uniref:HAD family hydrolase n=1 Tax=Enterococcus rivorum TaxID=762845 RepID=A0A1E5KUV0_9ENTE|nr:HAD family phosphatase [Enterococcus rivorum]MBP2100517.1 HAD superfamily hydrolase (TIGR01509 family) [Enterococcus rivorum]OEH81641.1 HAD family hydrolase [Enterococcus rivorum]